MMSGAGDCIKLFLTHVATVINLLHTELEDGRQFTLTAGMSYQVGSNAEGHRSFSTTGAKLFVVD